MAKDEGGCGPPTPLDFEQTKELLKMQFEMNMAMLDKLVEMHNARIERNDENPSINIDDVIRAVTPDGK